jgi:hypothetical protein
LVVGGTGGADDSGGTDVVVVSDVVVGAVVVVVVDDGRVVDGGVLAGPPPRLSLASMTRPQMIVAIRSTTATPHSARTQGLRYQGEGSSVNSSSPFSPNLESL